MARNTKKTRTGGSREGKKRRGKKTCLKSQRKYVLYTRHIICERRFSIHHWKSTWLLCKWMSDARSPGRPARLKRTHFWQKTYAPRNYRKRKPVCARAGLRKKRDRSVCRGLSWVYNFPLIVFRWGIAREAFSVADAFKRFIRKRSATHFAKTPQFNLYKV